MTTIEIYNDNDRARQSYWAMSRAERDAKSEAWHEEFKARFAEVFPNSKIIEFRDKNSKLDGVVVGNDGKIGAYVEIKCRNLTSGELKEKAAIGAEWIIDKAKMDAGIMHANAANTKFIGFIYCVLDRTIVQVPLHQGNSKTGGETLASYHTDYRETSDGNAGTFSASNVCIVSIEKAKYFEVANDKH